MAKSKMIISDDRNGSREGVCENCGRSGMIRDVPYFSGLFRIERGHVAICFTCFGPRIQWRPRGKRAMPITSPATVPTVMRRRGI